MIGGGVTGCKGSRKRNIQKRRGIECLGVINHGCDYEYSTRTRSVLGT